MTPQSDTCERLAASRERLRQAMQMASTGSGDGGGTGADSVLGSLAGDVLATWWSKQPLHTAWLMAADAANALARPVAQRHPYALVLGAAGLGGLLVLVRPWRWISIPALVYKVLSQLRSK